jgi:hypothetical protein
MSVLAAPVARAFSLSWLLLGLVLGLGRVGLMLADTTIDLRFPSFFELTVLPPLQAAALLWVARRWRLVEARQVLATSFTRTAPRRALIAGALAAVAVVAARVAGLAPRTLERDGRFAFGVLALIVAAAAIRHAVRSSERAERVDWALGGLLAGVVGSNAILGWLDTVSIRALPAGVGAPVAHGALAAAGITAATLLGLRLERWMTSGPRALLWSALAALLAASGLRFLVWLLGYFLEPWATTTIALHLLAGAFVLAGVLAPTAPAHPASKPTVLGRSVSITASSASAPELAWWRIWLVLALVHVALSVTMRLALFPEWQIDGLLIASWIGVTAAQAGALAAVQRVLVRRTTTAP